MESRSDPPPIIIIVGETASGKSALAMKIAERWNGEIIAADSRTVYKGMNIGTAKPSKDDMRLIPHHLIDVVTPDQSFSAAEFQRLAQKAITDISGRGKLPIVVGGTGLYIDALIFNFSFANKPDMALRTALQSKTVDELQNLMREKTLPLPVNAQNPRHLIRAIETAGVIPAKGDLRPNTLILGLTVEREVLREKITNRVEAMLRDGLLQEVESLAATYGWDAPGLSAPGYKAFRQYIEGQVTLEEAKQLFVRNDMQLAKRQRTWFKRNKSINWISKMEDAVDLMTTFLNK